MSGMDLRSSRSRSRTPFTTQEAFSKDEIIAGNNVGKTVIRTTRRTTHIIQSNKNASSSTDEVNTAREQVAESASNKKGSKSGRSLRSRIFRTSDYSSEDGDNEVSSSRTIKQNEQNQLVEDARSFANESDMPALELYRKSGRYWDVYPKTDWTYSQYSKDRVEIAPGVVAMPNMSRKTIHSLDGSSQDYSSFQSSESLYSGNVAHKNTNTDYIGSVFNGSRIEHTNTKLANQSSDDFYIHRRRTTRRSFKEIITLVFFSIFTTISTIFRYFYKTQISIFSRIHRVASTVMLWDTYLLWKTISTNKTRNLLILCLLPLLIFGGLWLLPSLGSVIYGTLTNYTINTSKSLLDHFWINSEDKLTRIERQTDVSGLVDVLNSKPGFNSFHEGESGAAKTADSNEKIVKIIEKVYVQPPSASDIASGLTKEQLETIAFAVKNSLNLNAGHSQMNTEELVKNIINSPTFVNEVNNYCSNERGGDTVKTSSSESGKWNEELLSKQQVLVNSLLKEINNMKEDIVMNNKLRSEEYARLSFSMKECCEKRPVINVDGYVLRIVTDLLNSPEFLQNQTGLNSWLQSLFLAKQDLQYHLGNLTASMDSKLASVVESNSHTLMEKVADKLVEINKKPAESIKVSSENVLGLTDENFVKKIVKEALTIYDADRTGLVDYAMESMGGQIVSTRCTEAYYHGKAVVSVLGIPLWHLTNSPRTIIKPTIAPGDCWAFQNFPGFVVLKLSGNVKIDAFSMEHISRLLLPEGKIDSAPKDFEVYGLKIENDREPVLLGSYRYEYDGDTLQFFLVEKDSQVFDMIEIRILSNHGNPNYTCLYRFRVHGKLHHDENR
ncbi:hypothetical protein HUJ04_007852 [Dendroctonus ponderosae]|uniref:SUN domain-containing protein n=1 Tax=Dendroctonus ponderosae TaxID=77166 RepID=A0AAR5PBT4_DENPD|nr:hypothetical protein HUJ04_007852 [Dendroctonus ponderosae]